MRVLQLLLRWKTYRTFKSGILLDFYVKRIFFYFSKQFFYIFTIFFGDKFILEHFFSNFYNFFQIISTKIKFNNKFTFLNFFKTSLLIISYFFLILLIIII